MMILRLLGGWFGLAATLAVIYDITRSASSKSGYVVTSLGEHWFKLHVASLNLTQAFIERYVSPKLWDPFILTTLRAPAWLVLGLIGMSLYLLGRRRRRITVYAN